jgi:plastocyanin
MRFIGKALVMSAVVLGACGGGEKKEEAPAAAATPAPAPAAEATPAAPAGGAAPITGATIEIKMIGDAKGYRFEPAEVTAKTGDALKFVFVSGGPHNVAFDAAKVPADMKVVLDANFGASKMSELSSNMMMNPGDAVTLSLGGVKAGEYEFHCTPHLAMNMKGKLTIK